MKCVATCALVPALALLNAGCGGAAKAPTRVAVTSPYVVAVHSNLEPSRVPFVPDGIFATGGAVGFDGGDGFHLSCAPGRLFAQAVGLRNRSRSPVTLTDATGEPEGALRIIRRVAAQFRLEPRPQSMGIIVMRPWSAARARPVTIPAGRSAIVQSNFRITRCKGLPRGRTFVVPNSLRITYRTGGKTRSQAVTASFAGRIILMHRPEKQACAPVSNGSSSIVVASLDCPAARKAAVACHRGAYTGTCKEDGHLWDCLRGDGGNRPWPVGEICWLDRNEARWFSAKWRHAA